MKSREVNIIYIFISLLFFYLSDKEHKMETVNPRD